MDAGLLGGLIGVGVMAGVVIVGAIMDKCGDRCRRRKKPPLPVTSTTPLLSTSIPKPQFKVSNLFQKPSTLTITRQNGSRVFQTIPTP